MWLINTHDGKLKEFIGRDLPPYAILSHRWADAEQEANWKDYLKGRKRDTTGYRKISSFLELSRSMDLEWAWVDTCCIDKKSSAELSEAINSMWRYYADASICCVYLVDAGDDWTKSDWWTRGWTLQELLAPRKLCLYNQDWHLIGTRNDLAQEITRFTRLPIRALTGYRYGEGPLWSVAERMSWAVGRKTLRLEDRAYSLLGLFNINMPLLYGEGDRAFQRLSYGILERSSDQSIFAWHQGLDLQSGTPLLASSPDNYTVCRGFTIRNDAPTSTNARHITPPRMTSWGIKLHAEVYRLIPRKPSFRDSTSEPSFLALPLTITRYGLLISLPCTLVLVQGGRSPHGYQCCGAIHDYPQAALKVLSTSFDIGDKEPGMLLYLDIGAA